MNERLSGISSSALTEKITARDLLRRPEVSWQLIKELTFSEVSDEIGEKIASEIKYEGYIRHELGRVQKFRRMEQLKIEDKIDYEKVIGLFAEGRSKLIKIRPHTLGQASRIPGVPPSDIQLLWVALES